MGFKFNNPWAENAWAVDGVYAQKALGNNATDTPKGIIKFHHLFMDSYTWEDIIISRILPRHSAWKSFMISVASQNQKDVFILPLPSTYTQDGEIIEKITFDADGYINMVNSSKGFTQVFNSFEDVNNQYLAAKKVRIVIIMNIFI